MKAADLAKWAAALPPDAEVLLEHPDTHELQNMLPTDEAVCVEDGEQLALNYVLAPVTLTA